MYDEQYRSCCFLFWFIGGEKPPRPAPPVLAHKEIGCFYDKHLKWGQAVDAGNATRTILSDMTSAKCSKICEVNVSFNTHTYLYGKKDVYIFREPDVK